jgi:hypothetical protein
MPTNKAGITFLKIKAIKIANTGGRIDNQVPELGIISFAASSAKDMTGSNNSNKTIFFFSISSG